MKEEIQNLSEEILEIEYKLNSYITSRVAQHLDRNGNVFFE